MEVCIFGAPRCRVSILDHPSPHPFFLLTSLGHQDTEKSDKKSFGFCMCMLSHFSHVRLCDPMDCSPPGYSVHGDSPGKNTGVSCHALLRGIFPTQGSNLSLRQILYRLSHAAFIMVYKALRFYFIFWLRGTACKILVSELGTDPGPTAVKGWSPNH